MPTRKLTNAERAALRTYVAGKQNEYENVIEEIRAAHKKAVESYERAAKRAFKKDKRIKSVQYQHMTDKQKVVIESHMNGEELRTLSPLVRLPQHRIVRSVKQVYEYPSAIDDKHRTFNMTEDVRNNVPVYVKEVDGKKTFTTMIHMDADKNTRPKELGLRRLEFTDLQELADHVTEEMNKMYHRFETAFVITSPDVRFLETPPEYLPTEPRVKQKVAENNEDVKTLERYSRLSRLSEVEYATVEVGRTKVDAPVVVYTGKETVWPNGFKVTVTNPNSIIPKGTPLVEGRIEKDLEEEERYISIDHFYHPFDRRLNFAKKLLIDGVLLNEYLATLLGRIPLKREKEAKNAYLRKLQKAIDAGECWEARTIEDVRAEIKKPDEKYETGYITVKVI